MLVKAEDLIDGVHGGLRHLQVVRRIGWWFEKKSYEEFNTLAIKIRRGIDEKFDPKSWKGVVEMGVDVQELWLWSADEEKRKENQNLDVRWDSKGTVLNYRTGFSSVATISRMLIIS